MIQIKDRGKEWQITVEKEKWRLPIKKIGYKNPWTIIVDLFQMGIEKIELRKVSDLETSDELIEIEINWYFTVPNRKEADSALKKLMDYKMIYGRWASNGN